MEKIEYFQTSFETKINLSDAFISDLAVKYCEQQMKAGQVKKAVEFSSKIYKVQEVFMQMRSILFKAEIDNNNLQMIVQEQRRKLFEYERDDKALNELQDNSEIEERYKNEMIAFKDKYQQRIQELEIENDQLLKKLIRYNNESKI